MLRSNPPPLIHISSLNSRVFQEKEDPTSSIEQEISPLNLSRRRSISPETTDSEQFSNNSRIPDDEEVFAPRWKPRAMPLAIPFGEDISRFYSEQNIVYSPLLQNTEQDFLTNPKTPDRNVTLPFNYYQNSYWMMLRSLMQDHLKYNLLLKELSSVGKEKSTRFRELDVDKNHFDGGESDNAPTSSEKRDEIINEQSIDQESKTTSQDKKESDLDDGKTVVENQQKVCKLTNQFKCPQCDASYPHRFELNRHVKVSHVRPHRCHHCGKGFGHKNYLRVHIETVHMGRKSHKCEQCGKYLSTGGNLSVHIRTIHMGEKKYSCPICSRTFGQQCNMKTHMRRHYVGCGVMSAKLTGNI